RFIILQHDSGFYTLYAHLNDVLAEDGSMVRSGDAIATVGDSGSLLGPALHFEIRQGKKQLDPLEWLK
ncbi:MAG: M23 family metallopeptidase, partial [candidate division Zixibacteria bacterium]|nr:M23 family metallopeptidase [candidate division Zixibacteria bacterium]